MEVYLKHLKLRRIREIFEEKCLQTEKEKWPHQAFLLRLLEEEIESKNKTVEQKRLQAARFPSEKTMEDFDFTFQHSLSREKMVRLSSLEFIEKRENVMMIGPAGVGKTHLAIALGRKAITASYTVLFRTAQQLVEELYTSLADGTVAKRIQSYLRNDLLIIDEFDYLPMDKTASNHFFQAVSHLYEQKSIIVTSNLSFREWPTAFSSEAIAVATLNRLLHHSHRLIFDSDNHRLKGKKTVN